MSERFTVSANEHGLVRLFAVDLPEDEIAAFAAPESAADNSITAWPLRDALGCASLDSDYTEIFPVSNLTGLGLSGYLIEGLGIAEADITGIRTRLDALEGHVLIVLSRAFGGEETTLTPHKPLRWIGTFTEESAAVHFAPLPDQAAQGQLAPDTAPGVSDAAMSGRIATLALVILFALVGVMIWVAS